MVQNIKCLNLLPILWVVHKKLEKIKIQKKIRKKSEKYILMGRTWSLPRKLPKNDWEWSKYIRFENWQFKFDWWRPCW